MDPISQPDRDAFEGQTGFTIIGASIDYQPLADDLSALVNNQLSSVPWIPKGVISQVDDWMGRQVSGIYWIAVPVSSPVNRPAFLDTAEKQAWWADFTLAVQKARLAFAAKKITEGRAAMANAANDIAFWNRAISIAQFLATPVTAAEQGASMFLSSNVFMLAGLIGAGYLAYLYLSKSHHAAKANPPRRRKKRRR